MIAAFDSEEALILDELSPDADAADTLATIEEMHAENVAAVMVQGDLSIGGAERWAMDREPRPRSGPVTEGGPF